MAKRKMSRAWGSECAEVSHWNGQDLMESDKDKRGHACIRSEDMVRVARMFDPKYFKSLEGERRKIAVLTLERGFLPILRNCYFGMERICEMCQETKGAAYNPTLCTKKCPLFQAQELTEKLAPVLENALSRFHRSKNKGGGNQGAKVKA